MVELEHKTESPFFCGLYHHLKRIIRKSSDFFKIFVKKHFWCARGLFCEIFFGTMTERNKRASHMAEKSHQGYFPLKI